MPLAHGEGRTHLSSERHGRAGANARPDAAHRLLRQRSARSRKVDALKRTSLRLLFAAAAAALGARLILGQARSRRKRIPARTAPPGEAGSLSVILPVLNERDRVSGALEGLIVQGPWLREIIVVDGGSTDGTNEIIDWY